MSGTVKIDSGSHGIKTGCVFQDRDVQVARIRQPVVAAHGTYR